MGCNFPNLDGSTIIYESTDTNQEAIIEYLRESDMAVVDNNWSIKPFEMKGDLIVKSSPEGKEYIEKRNLENLEYLRTDEDGWGIYKLNFETTEIEDEPVADMILNLGGSTNILEGEALKKDDKVYIPVRFVLEGFDGNVTWDNPLVIIEIDGSKIVIELGSDKATVEGEVVLLSEVPIVLNNRTFMNIDDISQLFGFDIEVDSQVHIIR